MIERLAQTLIQDGMDQQASDIHILPYLVAYRIYLRLNGQMHYYRDLELNQGRKLIAHFKFLANMDVGERRRPQSGACSFSLANQDSIEVRLSTITDVNLVESLVMRLIFSQIHQAQQMNVYFPRSLDQIRQLVQRKSGMILISGPVGSGKTTTIYQLLRERIAKDPLQIITMEDPVEIREPLFLQTQVNEKIGISYDLLIKSALRHHPDILFIGEIRDEETARMTLRGALTGHLMIATIHAKDCQGVIARLLELRISQEQLKQSLIGVISQRLIPRYCPQCQTRANLTCPHIAKEWQRAALFEILSGPPLAQYFTQSNRPARYPRLNDFLRKAWAYGYINQEDYQHFEII